MSCTTNADCTGGGQVCGTACSLPDAGAGHTVSHVCSLPLLIALVLSGCLSPAQYCQTVDSTTCQRLFDCTSGAERDTQLQQFPDAKSCARSFDERLQCATQTEKSFCVGKAAACVDELEQISCDALASYRPTCAPPCE